MKYPTENGLVGVLCVNQATAKKCKLENEIKFAKLGKRKGKKRPVEKMAHVTHEDQVLGDPFEPQPHRDYVLDPRDETKLERSQPMEETKKATLGDRQLTISSTLDADQEKMLLELLAKNLDLFAWTIGNVPGIDPDFICHRLALDKGVRAVSQVRRKLNNEKSTAMEGEVAKLLAAKFIRLIPYPTWLANPVMVKKSNDKWRMCVDYTNLNKYCPKDPYPLPSIDKLVDGASGKGFLSLMDAYSGYNQIRMHPADEDKTAFMSGKDNYCYRTMPFGLKNAGATYQRLMDKVFHHLIGKTMEVYVDGMIVMAEDMKSHCANLQDAFTAIRRHNMRLNPDKCSFGVRGGKFLGYMISERGIDANPDQCRAIINMKSPSSIVEVQRLTGCIAALSRFIPQSGTLSEPFFKCLRKNSSCKWTEECEAAFEKLKKTLSTPPTLTKPQNGTPLLLYFSITDSALGTVLVQEIEGAQRIVYFTSHTLHGAEQRYQRIEKAILAVVLTARKLRTYFQSFLVTIKSDLPLRKILQRPDMAGHMVSWAVELSEYVLEFEQRGPIKAQVLADFVAELTPLAGYQSPIQWIL